MSTREHISADSTACDLPHGWARVRLKEIAAPVAHAITDGPFGSNLKSEHYTTTGPRVVRLQNIGDGEFLDEKACISEERYGFLCKHAVRSGDVVMAILGATLPRACVVPPWLGNAIVKADCVKLSPDRRLADPRFVVAILNSPDTRSAVSRSIKGIGRPRLNLRQVKLVELPLPPLAEQERIADRIDELFTDLSAGVAALERVRRKLKRYRSAVLHAAVTGRLTAQWRKDHNPRAEPGEKLLARILVERRRQWEERTLAKYAKAGRTPPTNWKARYKEPAPPKTNDLPDLPEGWCWASADSLLWDCSYGTSTRCDYETNGTPVLRIPNIARGELDLEDMKFATMPLGIDDDGRYLSPSDLLVCRTNGSIRLIGKAALVRSPFAVKTYFASYLIRLRISGPTVASLTHMLFESPLGRRFIEAHAASSAGQHNISMTMLQQMPVPLPPADEQVAIVEAASEKLSQIEAMEAEVERGLVRAGRLRQAILKAAFAGKLVPQDPNDEPAAVLLERIRSQRPAAERPTRKRSTRRRRKTHGPVER